MENPEFKTNKFSLKFSASTHNSYHRDFPTTREHMTVNTSIGTFRWEECLECGLIYQNPCPTPASIVNLYSSDVYMNNPEKRTNRTALGYSNYTQDEAIRVKLAKRKLSRLPGGLTASDAACKSLLEIGPGTGAFLAEARKLFGTVAGIDASSHFAHLAKTLHGVEVKHGLFEDYDFDGQRFDVICLWGALSNLYDPLRFLAKVRTLLNPNGILWFNYVSIYCLLAKLQGATFWMYSVSVCYQFTPASLRRLLSEQGFEIVAHHTDVQTVSLTKLFSQTRIPILWRIANIPAAAGVGVTIPIPGVYEVVARLKDIA